MENIECEANNFGEVNEDNIVDMSVDVSMGENIDIEDTTTNTTVPDLQEEFLKMMIPDLS